MNNALANELLRPPLTGDYEPPDLALSAHYFHPNRPLFTLWHVDAMLTDARVKFGLDLLRGPIISNSKILVNADLPVKTYLIEQINRFWRNSIQLALRFMDYGYLGCEVIYRTSRGRLAFDRLKFLHPHHTRVVTIDGNYVGIEVARIGNVLDTMYVGRPKCIWFVHARDQHAWYGRSRLRGSFLAWYEIWSDLGYRDQRRTWFYKNAYAGPKVGYPPGSAPPEIEGDMPTPHRVIAQELVDKMVAGTGVTYPVISGDSKGGWIIEDANPISVPEGLLEYGDQLRDEIWEGMGIPPEVARAEGTGAFAGRRVPQQAFYSLLQEIVQDIISDLDDQILRPLVQINFGNEVEYEIEVLGLLRTSPEEEEEAGEENPGESPTGPSPGYPSDQPQGGGGMGMSTIFKVIHRSA